MDSSYPASTSNDFSDNRNYIIIGLLFLLLLMFIGINVFGNITQLLKQIFDFIVPTILNVLSLFGVSSGILINNTADAVAKGTKLGVDIADGTANSIGKIVIDESKLVGGLYPSPAKPTFDKALVSPQTKNPPPPPSPDNATNPIQNPISTNKTKWCLVGDENGKRGCINISDHDKCLSGQVFPSQKMCLNPNLSQ